MKKLRLIITYDCNRSCSYCSMKQPWTSKENVPVVPALGRKAPTMIPEDVKTFVVREKFSEVVLTGGEPILYPDTIIAIASALREYTKVYVYTALIPGPEILDVLSVVDGLTVTLHTQKDVVPFQKLCRHLYNHPILTINKSLRVKTFLGVFLSLPTNNEDWVVQPAVEPLKESPLPEGEILYRLP